MTETPALPLRILLGSAAALWAVLVPGQAAALVEQPLEWPQWLRLMTPGPGDVRTMTSPAVSPR